mgnify:CR=1 FL=1
MWGTGPPKLCGEAGKMKLPSPIARSQALGQGKSKMRTALGENPVIRSSDRGSIPLASTIKGLKLWYKVSVLFFMFLQNPNVKRQMHPGICSFALPYRRRWFGHKNQRKKRIEKCTHFCECISYIVSIVIPWWWKKYSAIRTQQFIFFAWRWTKVFI